MIDIAAGISPPLHWLADGHMTSNKYETVYRHMPRAGNIAKNYRDVHGKQFTVTHKILSAVAPDQSV